MPWLKHICLLAFQENALTLPQDDVYSDSHLLDDDPLYMVDLYITEQRRNHSHILVVRTCVRETEKPEFLPVH